MYEDYYNDEEDIDLLVHRQLTAENRTREELSLRRMLGGVTYLS